MEPLSKDTKQKKTGVDISVNVSTNDPSACVSPGDLQISQT